VKGAIESALYDRETGALLFASRKEGGKLPPSLEQLITFYQKLKKEAAPLANVDIIENEGEQCLIICDTSEKYLFVTKVSFLFLEEIFSNFFNRFHLDGLTCMLRKEFGIPAVASLLSDFVRYSTPFSVMFIDADHFKSINDQYGHLVGDEVLKGISQIIHHSLRDGDQVVRYGGEEFLVLLKQTEIAAAFKVAERLRNAIATTPLATQAGALYRTVSIGLTTPQVDDTPLSLIERADRALYQAKTKGRNRVEYL